MPGHVALAAAAAFNLICSGTTHSSKGFAENYPDAPFNEVYRVNLTSKRWCSRECTETQPIFEVTPERIVFEQDIRGDYDDTGRFVNRENGVYAYRDRRLIGSDIFLTWTRGSCKRAPFSGFPARKF